MTKTRQHLRELGPHARSTSTAIVSSIGPKVKKLRQEQRLSLQQLAVKAEVSAAAIHKIERNDMVPTITTLLKVASALDRPVTLLRRAATAISPSRWRSRRPSDRPAVFTPHAGLTLAGISGPYAPFRSAAALATRRTRREQRRQATVHAGEELVFTLEGTLIFDIAGTRHEVGVGDALHFMGDQPHHWVNEGKSEARALWIALRDS